MYGSCATQLDLPSSDLDLVVCGLDDVVVDHIHPSPSPIIDQQQSSMGSSLQHASSNSILQQGELPQEFVPMSPVGQQLQYVQPPPTPVSVDGQQPLLQAGSFAESVHSAGGEPSASPSEQQLSAGSFAEGDSGMILNGSYSPVPETSGGNYSSDYNESSHQGGDMTPGYVYQSQHDGAVGESYRSPAVYQGDGGGMAEGYGQEYQNGHEYYYSPYSYAQTLSLNAQRVLRLASELEQQPWAVQVKAIPTATVPVVKMLADPSKLPGLAGAGFMMQQHIAGVVAGEIPPPPLANPDKMPQQQGSGFFTKHQMTPQWRGADIMNGLQSVDITFEGPEHGGIGSTTYSARVVQDACDETGLPAESTPVVQVASVLKELLAQRRLNEPFSGGLSSYGLLLLLLAVLKDRKIIQEELKKNERQRQKVSGEDNARPARKQREPSSGSKKSSTLPTVTAPMSTASPGVDSDKSSAAPSANSKPTASSWASIAKKSSNGAPTRADSLSTATTKSTSGSATTLTAKTASANYSQVVKKECKDKGASKDNITDQSLPQKPDGKEIKSQPLESSTEKKESVPQSNKDVALDGPQSAALSQVTPSSEDDAGKLVGSSSTVPQGSNDVLEVLCSGELTSGKLLMHFLLFYGQHFDARSTLIDINTTHHPEYGVVDISRLSPFVSRPPGGTIDPITGMFSVDPIVVYDPLEGAIDHNVSKRCYCWNNVKWVFAQSYMTVSSIVETSDTTTRTKSCSSMESKKHKHDDTSRMNSFHEGEGKSTSGNVKSKEAKPSAASNTDDDVMTGILELLLSF